ncbi:polar growth protein [Phlyctochytrium bullatum]|nr:polar growth protein [Phlyctochytrium bullatum]
MNGGLSAGNVLSWTVGDVGRWLKSNDLDYATKAFEQNDVDGEVLLKWVTREALKEHLGITSLGKRYKLYQAIEDLRRQASISASLAPVHGEIESASSASTPLREHARPAFKLDEPSLASLREPLQVFARPKSAKASSVSSSTTVLPTATRNTPKFDVTSSSTSTANTDGSANASQRAYSPVSGHSSDMSLETGDIIRDIGKNTESVPLSQNATQAASTKPTESEVTKDPNLATGKISTITALAEAKNPEPERAGIIVLDAKSRSNLAPVVRRATDVQRTVRSAGAPVSKAMPIAIPGSRASLPPTNRSYHHTLPDRPTSHPQDRRGSYGSLDDARRQGQAIPPVRGLPPPVRGPPPPDPHDAPQRLASPIHGRRDTHPPLHRASEVRRSRSRSRESPTRRDGYHRGTRRSRSRSLERQPYRDSYDRGRRRSRSRSYESPSRRDTSGRGDSQGPPFKRARADDDTLPQRLPNYSRPPGRQAHEDPLPRRFDPRELLSSMPHPVTIKERSETPRDVPTSVPHPVLIKERSETKTSNPLSERKGQGTEKTLSGHQASDSAAPKTANSVNPFAVIIKERSPETETSPPGFILSLDELRRNATSKATAALPAAQTVVADDSAPEKNAADIQPMGRVADQSTSSTERARAASPAPSSQFESVKSGISARFSSSHANPGKALSASGLSQRGGPSSSAVDLAQIEADDRPLALTFVEASSSSPEEVRSRSQSPEQWQSPAASSTGSSDLRLARSKTDRVGDMASGDTGTQAYVQPQTLGVRLHQQQQEQPSKSSEAPSQQQQQQGLAQNRDKMISDLADKIYKFFRLPNITVGDLAKYGLPESAAVRVMDAVNQELLLIHRRRQQQQEQQQEQQQQLRQGAAADGRYRAFVHTLSQAEEKILSFLFEPQDGSNAAQKALRERLQAQANSRMSLPKDATAPLGYREAEKADQLVNQDRAPPLPGHKSAQGSQPPAQQQAQKPAHSQPQNHQQARLAPVADKRFHPQQSRAADQSQILAKSVTQATTHGLQQQIPAEKPQAQSSSFPKKPAQAQPGPSAVVRPSHQPVGLQSQAAPPKTLERPKQSEARGSYYTTTTEVIVIPDDDDEIIAPAKQQRGSGASTSASAKAVPTAVQIAPSHQVNRANTSSTSAGSAPAPATASGARAPNPVTAPGSSLTPAKISLRAQAQAKIDAGLRPPPTTWTAAQTVARSGADSAGGGVRVQGQASGANVPAAGMKAGAHAGVVNSFFAGGRSPGERARERLSAPPLVKPVHKQLVEDEEKRRREEGANPHGATSVGSRFAGGGGPSVSAGQIAQQNLKRSHTGTQAGGTAGPTAKRSRSSFPPAGVAGGGGSGRAQPQELARRDSAPVKRYDISTMGAAGGIPVQNSYGQPTRTASAGSASRPPSNQWPHASSSSSNANDSNRAWTALHAAQAEEKRQQAAGLHNGNGFTIDELLATQQAREASRGHDSQRNAGHSLSRETASVVSKAGSEDSWNRQWKEKGSGEVRYTSSRPTTVPPVRQAPLPQRNPLPASRPPHVQHAGRSQGGGGGGWERGRGTSGSNQEPATSDAGRNFTGRMSNGGDRFRDL